jgi:type I restriction enzyme S subunit
MDKNNKIPEIRFKGFEEDWVESNFNYTFRSLSNNTLSRADLNYETGLAKNIHYGDILIKFKEILDVQSDEIPFISNNELADKFTASKLQNGDVIFADAAEDETVGKCTEIINVHTEIVYPGLHTIAVRPTFFFASKYLGYYLNSPAYHNQLLRLMQGTKVSSISKSAIKDTSIIHPKDTTEQKHIGTFFQNLDNLITLHQKKYDRLVILKKAMLVKMFPKNGALVPEIRFKGYSGDWEEKKLGDTIIDIVDNRGKNPQYYLSNGIPIIDNFMIKNNFYPDLKKATRFIDDNLFENFIRKYNEVNDVLITLVGNSIGNITLFPDKKSVIIQNTLGLRFGNDKIFMFFYLLSLNKKLKNLNRGMAQPSIRQDELLGIDITTPINSKEQQKIGEYFKNLDNQIALHKTQLDKINTIKKACFTKMFVAQN